MVLSYFGSKCYFALPSKLVNHGILLADQGAGLVGVSCIPGLHLAVWVYLRLRESKSAVGFCKVLVDEPYFF